MSAQIENTAEKWDIFMFLGMIILFVYFDTLVVAPLQHIRDRRASLNASGVV
jgi:hypothetical protein